MKHRIELVKFDQRPGQSPGGRHFAHEALAQHPDAVPVSAAQLTDQDRLAVVLQGVCVLAHLNHFGWRLPRGWDRASLMPDGRLMVGIGEPGHDSVLPQTQLLRLVGFLFGHADVTGRGRARRALRQLIHRWQQTLAPIDLDRTVAAIFDAAPFLWESAFAPARRALISEFHDGMDEALWVVGPGPARCRILAEGGDLNTLHALVTSERASAIWSGVATVDHDPQALAEQGRYDRAVRIWQQRPLMPAADVLIYAQALFALGRFERAMTALQGRRSPSARLLRARCHAALGEHGAAMAAVRRLAGAENACGSLDGSITVQLAELAVRLTTLAGKAASRKDWVARAISKARGSWQARAQVLRALAAYDAGDAAGMDVPLAAAEKAMDVPHVAWRWHHARALQAILREDGPTCIRHVRRALSVERRKLPRSTAGRLWSTLVVGYGLCDDLAAAEKAIRHSLRLFSDCDGPIGATLALHNLAEVRVRRGRFDGVEAIIDSVLRQNRRAGNVRGRARTLSLRMRVALGRGRLAEAMSMFSDAMDELAGTAADVSRLQVLAARALGWQGQSKSARAVLEQGAPTGWIALEPEERPALLALVGWTEEADRQAQDTIWAPIWRAMIAGRTPSHDAWQALETLEPYRAARLVFDFELFRPGVVPPDRVRSAMETLRGCGAIPLAERLEARGASPWAVVDAFLAHASADPVAALAETLGRLGHHDVRISFLRRRPDDHASGARADRVDREVLIDGGGGEERFVLPLIGGRLQADSDSIGTAVQVLLGLFARIWKPPSESAGGRQGVGSGLVGESPALLAAVGRLERLARVDLPLLILGESGTGKELAARHAHRSSGRSIGKFVAVNCADVSESLIRSDLFGHVRGAFTGADRDRRGVFEIADGGTVFLDEIGDLPLAVQGTLLRVLQESEIRRVGEPHSRPVDVRVVTATHRDLEAMVQAGSFRQDLFYRLKSAMVVLPPLRDRGEDLLRLADHFLASTGCRLSASARRRIRAHLWPGNVRELRNTLEVAATLCDNSVIEPEQLDLPTGSAPSDGILDYQHELDKRRRKLLTDAILASGGNRAEAARRLRLTRQALSYLVSKLDLHDLFIQSRG